jgi:crossover junction endodeoxyribonuclease RuvC
MPNFKQQIILGVDPGYAITGWGVIKKNTNEPTVMGFGVIKTTNKKSFSQRLEKLSLELNKIIKKYKPNVVAIEDIFFYNNAKTVIKVGEARGVVVLTAVNNHLPVYNFTPLQVKQAVTSYGRAEKGQVQKMIKILLKLKTIPKPDDAADALAVAYCCTQSLNSLS